MSKKSATFYCADCGSDITVYGSNQSYANRDAAKRAADGDVCPSCSKSRFDAKLADAAINTDIALSGVSDRQIAYGLVKRNEFMSHWTRVQSEQQAIVAKNIGRAFSAEFINAVETLIASDTAQTAQFWIESAPVDYENIYGSFAASGTLFVPQPETARKSPYGTPGGRR